MHVHTLWDPVALETFLPLLLANGVTGVRDMGGTLEVLRAFRAEPSGGSQSFPRMVAAGYMLDGPEPIDPSISAPIAQADGARRAVRELSAAGADFIKIYTLLPREAFFAVIDEARMLGLPVAGHVPASVSAEEAADAGIASIEHMRAESGGFCDPGQPVTCREIFEAFRRNGTWQVPTLAVRRARAIIDDPALAADPRLAYVPAAAREIWQETRSHKLDTMPEEYFREIKEQFDREVRLAGALHGAGIRLLAGSDAGALFSFPGFTLHDELVLLVEAGLSPMEALQAATRNAAEFLQLSDELGTIEEGKVADLVLLDGNPLVKIENTRRIRAVMRDGRLWERPELDRMLDRVLEVVEGERRER